MEAIFNLLSVNVVGNTVSLTVWNKDTTIASDEVRLTPIVDRQ